MLIIITIPNITSAGAVDWEFVNIYCPFGFPWVSLGCLWLPLGQLWVPLGSLWGALGLPLAILWGPFGHLESLWDPFGAPWAALGRLLDLIKNWTSKCAVCIVKHSNICVFGAHRRHPLLPLLPLKWCHEVLLAPPLPPRRGSG